MLNLVTSVRLDQVTTCSSNLGDSIQSILLASWCRKSVRGNEEFSILKLCIVTFYFERPSWKNPWDFNRFRLPASPGCRRFRWRWPWRHATPVQSLTAIAALRGGSLEIVLSKRKETMAIAKAGSWSKRTGKYQWPARVLIQRSLFRNVHIFCHPCILCRSYIWWAMYNMNTWIYVYIYIFIYWHTACIEREREILISTGVGTGNVSLRSLYGWRFNLSYKKPPKASVTCVT